MFRIYFLQLRYALADEALEDAIYDSQAMRDFFGIDLAVESVPDATTLLRFRLLLEKHALTQRDFEEINAGLAEQGLFMREGTIVDATIVAAAPSTKKQARQRDSEMKQTKKGKQWDFGLKAHVDVDAVTGLTHSVVATLANVADVTMVGHLIRDEDEQVRLQRLMEAHWRREGQLGLPVLCRCQTRHPQEDRRQPDEDAAAGIREGQGQHPRQGGVPVSFHQEPLRLSEGSLQGAGQESGAAV
jgi:IS5 family transposase